LTRVLFDPTRWDFFTLRAKIEKFRIFRENFQTQLNQRWLTRPEQQKFDLTRPGSKIFDLDQSLAISLIICAALAKSISMRVDSPICAAKQTYFSIMKPKREYPYCMLNTTWAMMIPQHLLKDLVISFITKIMVKQKKEEWFMKNEFSINFLKVHYMSCLWKSIIRMTSRPEKWSHFVTIFLLNKDFAQLWYELRHIHTKKYYFMKKKYIFHVTAAQLYPKMFINYTIFLCVPKCLTIAQFLPNLCLTFPAGFFMMIKFIINFDRIDSLIIWWFFC